MLSWYIPDRVHKGSEGAPQPRVFDAGQVKVSPP